MLPNVFVKGVYMCVRECAYVCVCVCVCMCVCCVLLYILARLCERQRLTRLHIFAPRLLL